MTNLRYESNCEDWKGGPEFDLAVTYLAYLETALSDDVCLCLWQIHPADVDEEPGKRRKRVKETHPACPVHTREGVLAAFLTWTMDASLPTTLRRTQWARDGVFRADTFVVPDELLSDLADD